jgi:hypothetical protein
MFSVAAWALAGLKLKRMVEATAAIWSANRTKRFIGNSLDKR